MKKYLEGYMKGLSIGMGILTILGITGVAYGAYVSMTDVTNGETLTASTFNQLIENVSVLKSTVDGIGSGVIPVGAVMAFNGSSCPTGWTAADGSGDEKNTSGTNTTLDLRGEFIRGLDGGRGVDASRTLASAQAQDWKGFYQHNTGQNTYSYSHGPVYMGKSTSSYVGNLFIGMWSTPSAAMGTRWDDSEVRPRNVALLYCVKQ